MPLSLPKLDPKEEHFRIASDIDGLALFLRYLPPNTHQAGASKIVLYVHGGSFPSALSIAHRFDGRSWRDELTEAGFHVWGLDFQGFGASDPYPEMAKPPELENVLGRAEAASQQIERAARFICDHHGAPKISIIAHSWGTIATGRFAGRCPELVERLVFFGPVTWAPEEGGASRRRFLQASRVFFRRATSRYGDRSISTQTRRADLVRRQASRRRADRGRTSPPPARAISPTILASFALPSRLSVVNGTASRPMPTRAGFSMR
jgi:pimeloyl-ACP methyl ester carboxylesterase